MKVRTRPTRAASFWRVRRSDLEKIVKLLKTLDLSDNDPS
jgi:hypothetical protein